MYIVVVLSYNHYNFILSICIPVVCFKFQIIVQYLVSIIVEVHFQGNEPKRHDLSQSHHEEVDGPALNKDKKIIEANHGSRRYES